MENSDKLNKIHQKIEKRAATLKQQDPVIKKKIEEVYEVETRLAILLAISNFGSLNIKKIAKLLGKNEATIYHHLKFLKIKPKLIQSDTEKTDTNRGIYYELTPLAKKYFADPIIQDVSQEMIEKLDEFIQLDKKEIVYIFESFVKKHPDIGQLANQERQKLVYNHIIENIMVSNLAQAEQAYLQGLTPINPDYPFGSLSNSIMTMKISHPKHHFEIVKLITEFALEFKKLNEKIKKEMDSEEIPESERIDFQLSMVGGEISRFKFK